MSDANSEGGCCPSGTKTARTTRTSGPGVELSDGSGNETLPRSHRPLFALPRLRANRFHARPRDHDPPPPHDDPPCAPAPWTKHIPNRHAPPRRMNESLPLDEMV